MSPGARANRKIRFRISGGSLRILGRWLWRGTETWQLRDKILIVMDAGTLRDRTLSDSRDCNLSERRDPLGRRTPERGDSMANRSCLCPA